VAPLDGDTIDGVVSVACAVKLIIAKIHGKAMNLRNLIAIVFSNVRLQNYAFCMIVGKP
jgi:hypothetical protein